MASFCEINFNGDKVASTKQRMRDAIAYGRMRDSKSIRDDIDRENTIMPGSYGVLEKAGISQVKRGNYSRYLESIGVSNIMYSNPISDISLSDNIGPIVEKSGYDGSVYSTIGSGEPIGIKSKNPLEVTDTDPSLSINAYVMEAISNNNDAVIIHRQDDDIIIPLNSETVQLGTQSDIDNFNKFIESQLDSDHMDDDLLSDMQSKITIAHGENLPNDQRIAIDFANEMSQRLNVDYNIVTLEDAIALTKGSYNPITADTNKVAFFYNDRIYFIKGRINTKSVFHEFSHPFIRAIKNHNRELFDNLYDMLEKTPEGSNIIASLKNDEFLAKPENVDLLKEEAIVLAISSINEETMVNTDGLLNTIMYHIKRFMRKVFGKYISISDLKPSTSLRELVDILNQGNEIDVDVSEMSGDNVVMYDMVNVTDDVKQTVKDEIGLDKCIDAINSTQQSMKRILSTIKENSDFASMARIVGENVDLEELKKLTSGYNEETLRIRENVMREFDRFKDSYDRNLDAATTFVRMIYSIDSILDDLLKAMNKVDKSKDYQSSTRNAYYAKHMIDSWRGFVTECSKACTSQSPVADKLYGMEKKISRCDDIINGYFQKNVRAFVKEQLWQMKNYVDEYYNKKITKAKEKGGSKLDLYLEHEFIKKTGMPSAEYDEFLDLYDRFKSGELKKDADGYARFGTLLQKYSRGYEITEMKIDLVASGLLGDAKWLNSVVESYTSNQNLIAMSLANYIEQNYGEALNRSLDEIHADYIRTEKLIRDAGLKDSDGSIRDTVCFLDKKLVYDYSKYDEELEKLKGQLKNMSEDEINARIAEWKRNYKPGLVEKDVWTYLNPFKGYTVAFEKSLNKLNSALADFRKHNTDDNYNSYINAKLEHQKFMRTYFNQKYKPEFYEIDDEFVNESDVDENDIRHKVGAIAVAEYNDLIDKINTLNDIQLTGTADVSVEIDELWMRAREMSYEVNADGTAKTGVELAKAKILKRYKKRKSSFYDNTFNLKRFTDAYNEFEQETASQFGKGSHEYESQMNLWMRQNTVECPKEEYFTRREEILNEINEIISKYKKADIAVEKDIQDNWKKINEITRNHRDDIGVIDPRSMSKSELDKLIELEDNNERLRDKDSKILSKEDKLRLNELRQELGEMQEKVISSHYIEDLKSVIGTMNETAYNMLPDYIKKDNIEPEDVEQFIQPANFKNIQKVMEQSVAFANFIKTHNIIVEVERKSSKGYTYTQKYLKVRYAYTSAYVNDNYMKSDANIEKLTGLKYRVPSYKWMDKSIKQQYITPLEVGKTVDNRGDFLPLSKEEMEKKRDRYNAINGVGSFEKQVINGENVDVDKFYNAEYFKLKKRNPKAFRLLEELVNIHLSHQQDLDSGSKLYLEVARLRKELYQGIREGNTIETIMMKIRQAIRIDETDVYDGSVNFNKTSSTCRSNWITADGPQEPIMGLFDIDAKDCEASILYTNEQYYNDIYRHKALVRMNPIVRAIQRLVNDTQIMNTSKVVVSNSGNAEFEKKLIRGREANVLKGVINALIGREFDGQFRLDDWNGRFEQIYIASYRWMTKRASFAYFGGDFQSGLKNFLGQKVQSFIEGAGGVGFNLSNFYEAESPSTSVMKEMASTGYMNPINSVNYQIVKYFDMLPGNTRNKFGKEFARSWQREAISGEHGTRIRKAVEMQATIQIGFAMLMNKKIKYHDANGDHEIRYADAFELVNSNLRLKDGIDKRYDVNPFTVNVTDTTTKEGILNDMNIPASESDDVFENIDLDSIKAEYKSLVSEMNDKISEIENNDYLANDKKDAEKKSIKDKYNKLIADRCTIQINNWFFKKMRSSITETFEQLNGAYQDYSQPQMNQYLLMKGFMFLRKYYVSMFAHKYAFRDIYREAGRTFMVPRYNVRKQDIEMPVYGDTFNLIYETLLYGGQNLDWMDETQRANMIRFVTELVVVGALIPMLSMLVMFGIDGDDDKYKSQSDKNKLIASWSGTIFDKNFNIGGYARQAAVLQLLKLQDEQSQFHPFLKGITGMYNFGLKSNMVFTSVTIDNWLKSLRSIVGIFNDSMHGVDKDDSAHYYTRDTGPYPWQKKGSPKFINYYMKSWGLNGSNIDPATSYKNFISYMGR